MKNTQHYYKKQKGLLIRRIFPAIIALLIPLFGYSQTTQSQVAEQWTVTTGSQNSFQRSIVRTATLGGQVYTFVAGATVNANGDYDMLVEKFYPGGGLMWAQSYDYSGGDDVATDVRIAANGDVYICGSYFKDATDSSNAIIIRYDANGNQLALKSYNGAGSRNDGFAALLVSATSVVAVGTTWTGSTNTYDMLTMRMDTSLATTNWTTTYDNSNMMDGAISLTSKSGAIFVTGASQTASTTYKIATWKLDPSTGSITSTTLSSGTAFGFDKVTAIAEDANGNVYICGAELNVSTGFDYKIIKYNSSLAVVWAANYTGAGGSLDDVATGLSIDSLGNVIVTGYTNTSTQGRNYATIKYNSSGSQQWVATYNGVANGNDSATAIVTKGTDIYVTGITHNGGNYDYLTIKYNTSGTQLWEIPWNSTPNMTDVATDIAIDTVGAVVVTGQTKIPGATSYVTIKYWQGTVIVPPDTAAAGPRIFEFTENRGQLRTLSGTSDSKAQYYNQSTTPQVYFQDGTKLSWLLTKIDTLVSTTDSIAQVDMYFANANSVQAYAVNPGEDYCAYYLSHLSDPAVRIQNFNQVIYPEIYSGIDFESGSHEGGIKYSFIVKPGGDPTDVDFYFGGASSVAMNGNNVRITTALGYIDLPQASAFQIDGSGNFSSLGWQPTYTITSGHVTFTNLGTYDNSIPLVFVFRLGSTNPTSAANGNLEFCSYGGTPNDDYYFDACAVEFGEIAVGLSMANGFPGSQGNYGGSYGGGQDGIIIYYQNDSLAFRSYIGGAGADVINAVALHGNLTVDHRVYFAGGSGSSGLPTEGSGPQYVQSLSGSNDAIIGEIYIDNQFPMPWFTYFGGSTGYETINDIFWDSGNLYFTGEGVTSTPLATETGASNYSTGKTLIGKFNSNDSLVWSTRFGSGAGNSIYRRNNALVVAGKISSSQTDLPIIVPSGFPYSVSSGAGSTDAFIARFDGNDTATWSTYYGGSSGDIAEGVAIDENNDIYVCGSTGSTNFPFLWQGTTNGYMDSTIWGSSDAFMLKFNSGGQRYWASLHGGQFGETFYEVVIDTLNNAYFLGVTGSHNMTPYNGGTTLYNQGTIGDNLLNSAYGDGMILMVDDALDTKWCTYFGGNKVDAIYGGSINAQYPDKMIACGGAVSDANFPWYGSGAISTNAGINTFDAWEARFDLSNINVVGFQEQQPVSDGNMVIYPSPGDGNVTVQVSTTEQPQSLMIYNSVGQLVYFINAPETDASGKISLNLSMLGEGIYFLNLQYADTVESEKFSIIR